MRNNMKKNDPSDVSRKLNMNIGKNRIRNTMYRIITPPAATAGE
jgi:hypothetical protein